MQRSSASSAVNGLCGMLASSRAKRGAAIVSGSGGCTECGRLRASLVAHTQRWRHRRMRTPIFTRHRPDAHLTLRYARRMADTLPSLPEQRMTFTALTPMLRSTDLVAALASYTDTLDFRIDGGGADAGWASLRHGSLALMLAAQQAPTDAAAAGFPG